jgi:hypothetical protein
MNTLNTKIVISRFNEDKSFIEKLDFITILYEKEQPGYKYNIEKNKGNEASVYLKYIIDNYDNLDEYTIFIHCHEFSWHHIGSIIDIINRNKNIHHTLTNLNNQMLGNMGDLDKDDTDIGTYFRSYIRPAVGPYVLYPNFTSGVLACAQFIVHKNNILHHSKLFYQKIFDWLMDTHLSNFWNGRYLEWTWDLFWNKCLKNIPIRKYQNEHIIDIQIENSNETLITDKKNEIIKSLSENEYYYVNDNEITIITNCNSYKCKNQYIYNKYI